MDFTSDDIDDDFKRVEENDNGIVTLIEFKDGSVICFKDDDVTIRSHFVSEFDFYPLNNEIDKIISAFRNGEL